MALLARKLKTCAPPALKNGKAGMKKGLRLTENIEFGSSAETGQIEYVVGKQILCDSRHAQDFPGGVKAGRARDCYDVGSRG